MKRTFIMVLDSFDIGATEDMECFDGVGADTSGHIAEVCAKDEVDNGCKGPLNLPNLTRLGLAKVHEGSTDFVPARMDGNAEVISAYARAHEISSGKGTPSGHWEIAGVLVLFKWGYFSDHESNFPQELPGKLVERTNLSGYLGDCHSSSTVILDQLGEEHMKAGKLIFYTSVDSVFQIVCHERIFGLDRPYEPCEITHEELTSGGYSIGCVIARPFTGDKAGNFQHTGNRHDPAIEPPAPTVPQKLVDEEYGRVVSVGKTADIHANCGITKKVKTIGLDMLLDATIKEMKEMGDNTIVFTNFANFNSSWGHRRSVVGYVADLELFDRHLPKLMSLLCDDDILTLTADHGCDPTWIGTNHTREHIPVLAHNPKVEPDSLGHRETFAGIDQTLVKYLGISDVEYGKAVF